MPEIARTISPERFEALVRVYDRYGVDLYRPHDGLRLLDALSRVELIAEVSPLLTVELISDLIDRNPALAGSFCVSLQ